MSYTSGPWHVDHDHLAVVALSGTVVAIVTFDPSQPKPLEACKDALELLGSANVIAPLLQKRIGSAITKAEGRS